MTWKYTLYAKSSRKLDGHKFDILKEHMIWMEEYEIPNQIGKNRNQMLMDTTDK